MDWQIFWNVVFGLGILIALPIVLQGVFVIAVMLIAIFPALVEWFQENQGRKKR